MNRFALLFVMVFGLSACGGGSGNFSDPAAVADKTVASISIPDGNNQTAIVGTQLPTALNALVLNKVGQPISGAVVNFVVTTGGGEVFAAAVMSDTNGLAKDVWTLGTRAGVNKAEVRAVDSSGTPVVYATFEATAVAGVAQTLNITSGDNQSAQQIQTLPLPITVSALDAYGNTVSGVQVVFTASNGGKVSPGSAVTDVTGIASATWTLGPTLGIQTMGIIGSGLTPITCLAKSTLAAPSKPITITIVDGNSQTVQQHSLLAMLIKYSFSNQTGSQPLKVLVTDALGHPVPGVSVNFAAAVGSGNINPISIGFDSTVIKFRDYPLWFYKLAITDSDGMAWWSGYLHTAGQQIIEASIQGVVDPARFIVNVTPFNYPYDGFYSCSTTVSQPIFFELNLGQGSYADMAGQLQFGISVNETDGTFNATGYDGHSTHYVMQGQLTIDSFQQITGTGPLSVSFQPPIPQTPPTITTGTWSCSRY